MLIRDANILKRINNKFFIFPKFVRRRKKSFEDLLKYLGFSLFDYFNIVEEILNDKEFNDSVNKEFINAGLSASYPFENICWPYFIYYLVRKIKPEIIVETGVWYGVSSSIILNALNKNNKGFLFSIDLPAYFETGGYRDENPFLPVEKRSSSLPPNKSPGFIIPDNLKHRWELILGDSKIFLPKLLEKLKFIDIFLHDSLHSYENMTFEFNLATKYVKNGGFIMSDNINWHNAFYDFCNINKYKYKTFLAYYESPKLQHNFGVINV